MWPTRGTKLHGILETVNALSQECINGRVPVTEIYNKLNESGRESIRVMLSQLKRNGLLEAPMRGMYQITLKGKTILNDKTSTPKTRLKGSKYDTIIDRFLVGEHTLAKVEIENKNANYLRSQLNKRIKIMEITDEVKASVINNIVYLEKLAFVDGEGH